MACTDTSRPEVGSSRIIRVGFRHNIRASPRRRCCPPLNSWGYKAKLPPPEADGFNYPVDLLFDVPSAQIGVNHQRF